MKTIGIIVAMDKELNLLLPLIAARKTVTINSIEFNVGKIGKHDVVVLKSGIGKVNAAVATLTLIDSFHTGLVINTGVAGGTGNGASVLDVVIADNVAYHDVWCGPGTVVGQAAGFPLYLESDTAARLKDKITNAKFGLIASGDIFVSRPEDIARIKRIYPQVMAVDMESAAIAQVCFMKNVDCLVVRVVSDTPGSADNIEQYENFWDDAPKSTFDVLNKVLEHV